MNPTSQATYKIIRYVLLIQEFNQTEIHHKTKTSTGQINKVVNWLLTRRFIEKGNKKYHVIDPGGIIAIFPLFRNMNDQLVCKIPIRGSMDKIIDILPKGSILCLDSAVDTYSSYFRTNRICIYHKKPELIKGKFKPYSGGLLDLHVYLPDMDLKEDIVNGVTSKLRTIIDMTCDGKTYIVKDLFEDLWGIKFE